MPPKKGPSAEFLKSQKKKLRDLMLQNADIEFKKDAYDRKPLTQ